MKTLMMSLLLLAALGSASVFASSNCSQSSGNKETREMDAKKESYLALLTPEEGTKVKAKSKDGRATR